MSIRVIGCNQFQDNELKDLTERMYRNAYSQYSFEEYPSIQSFINDPSWIYYDSNDNLLISNLMSLFSDESINYEKRNAAFLLLKHAHSLKHFDMSSYDNLIKKYNKNYI